jgi:hypothetical protein
MNMFCGADRIRTCTYDWISPKYEVCLRLYSQIFITPSYNVYRSATAPCPKRHSARLLKRGLVIYHNLCIRLRREMTTALFLWLNTEVLLMQIYAILINFANLCQQMLQNVDSVLTQKCVTA